MIDAQGDCRMGLLSRGVIVTHGDWSGVIDAGVIDVRVNVAKPNRKANLTKMSVFDYCTCNGETITNSVFE